MSKNLITTNDFYKQDVSKNRITTNDFYKK